jgi:hypothetical protein
MNTNKNLRVGIFLILAVLVTWNTAFAEGGMIEGVVKITAEDGQTAYGDWVRVLLVREKVGVPETNHISTLAKYEKIDHIVTAHMAFYKKIIGKMGDPAYIVASTLTRPDGTFKFSEISSGTYYLVVTFPSMIKGYKVAWQIPATVAEGGSTRVELTESNYLLPTYIRN